jgi:acid phosphatase
LSVFGAYGDYPLPYCGANLEVPLPPWGILSNYTLLSVKVMTRHGDRIADSLLPLGMEIAWNCDEANFLMGIGAPSTFYRTRPLTTLGGYILGTCSLGQLTDRGILMHQTLGTNLYTKYVSLLRFLTDDEICTYPAEVMYVRSTNIPRTIQSAQSNMYTFKQNCSSELVDIWIPYGIDEFQISSLPFICPAIYKNDFFSSSEAQIVYAQFSQLVTQAQEIFQNPSLSALDLITLYDPLAVRYCHIDTYPFPSNVPIPFMVQLYGFFNEIIPMSYNWIPNLVASPFMNTLLDDWVNYILNPNTNPLGPKYSLYSAHDTTIGYALGLMGLMPSLPDPPYASHMEFELWQQGDRYFIMITLNGYYLKLPTCSGDVICDFTQFYHSIPLLTNQQWQTLCYS